MAGSICDEQGKWPCFEGNHQEKDGLIMSDGFLKQFPAGLIDIEKAAAYSGIDKAVLKKWTESGHAPHCVIDGYDGPLYVKTKIAKWVKDNLVVENVGMPIPREMVVMSPACNYVETRSIPTSIAAIQSLCLLSIPAMCPGVYFLCDGGEVVYVGQDDHVLIRVAGHMFQSKKHFDRAAVFYVPCPKEYLHVMEAHFIDKLKPKYNTDGQNASNLKAAQQAGVALSSLPSEAPIDGYAIGSVCPLQ